MTLTENREGCSRTVGLSMSPRRSISLIHCSGLRTASIWRAAFAVLAVERPPADVDVVVVVAHRERVVGALEGHQGDDLVRLHRALQREQALDRDVGDRARALVADDRRCR